MVPFIDHCLEHEKKKIAYYRKTKVNIYTLLHGMGTDIDIKNTYWTKLFNIEISFFIEEIERFVFFENKKYRHEQNKII